MTVSGTGLLTRLNDELVAPRAGTGELLTTYLAALAGTGLAVTLAAEAGLGWLPVLVLGIVAFDMFGGAVANATTAAKHRFHAPGRTWRRHLGFVAIHLQPFLLALVVPGFGWATAAVVYAGVLAGAVLVLAVPGQLRRPAAFAVAVLGAAAATMLPVPDPVAWFVPTLLIKLLLGHLLPGEAGR
ncbi:hypothetical protein [Amycolatopsis aidingensis]|uniref:hypothetical protein n=1 Tax=Amycolatopsis aidingensis TaxID=2842453 RepID=UPI001C0CC88D|nr:hypothetical protein [Amycolatopsis aidingensis]